MPLFNLAWHESYFWDGRADSLEGQILMAIKSTSALAMNEEEMVKRISGVPGYAPLFAKAFGSANVSSDAITKALATYVRGITTSPAPFDKWLAGDNKAISASAQRGFDVFTGKGKCFSCHSGWDFTDHGFHDTGLPDADVGRGKIQPQVVSFDHAFKTPSLRNLFGRGPYMHDGSLTSVEQVVDYYNRGPEQHRDSVPQEVTQLNLAPSEKADLLAFLQSLQAAEKPTTMPVIPY